MTRVHAMCRNVSIFSLDFPEAPVVGDCVRHGQSLHKIESREFVAHDTGVDVTIYTIHLAGKCLSCRD